MKILTFTTLYPNAIQMRHGIFVEQRLRHLLQRNDVEAKVVAPVPWFPLSSECFGAYAQYARVPKQEQRHGIDIYHPRFPVIPKIGMTVAPALLAAATLPLLRKIIADGYDFDVLDAHYFYPDGVAAALLAKALHKPLVITARGSDVNVIADYHLPQKMLLWAARHAHQTITVCEALQTKLADLGADAGKITVLRNGVDLQLFAPRNRDEARAALKLTRRTLLSVGHLVENKGHHLIIDALKNLEGYDLLIVGDGEQAPALRKLAEEKGVADRVQFLGTLTHTQLVDIYSAVDALILASAREGWANVLLEAMACGTPVIATQVGGTPEVVRAPEAGVLINRSADDIANGVRQLFANYPNRHDTRRYAENFSWGQTVERLHRLFTAIIDTSPSFKNP
jgi:glycosyltransferase involved in cell wall biosynthesis